MNKRLIRNNCSKYLKAYFRNIVNTFNYSNATNRNEHAFQLLFVPLDIISLTTGLIDGLYLTLRRPCWYTEQSSKISFGNLTLLLRKTRGAIFYCIVHLHGRLITWFSNCQANYSGVMLGANSGKKGKLRKCRNIEITLLKVHFRI